MTALQSFTLNELSISIVSIIGAFAILIKAIQHSRCTTLKCGCCEISRNIDNIETEIPDTEPATTV